MADAVGIADNAPAAVLSAATAAGPAASAAVCSAASKGSQTKDDFGTLLYSLVLPLEPKRTRKITRMLLELSVEELHHLLGNEDGLRAKVHEAMQVLQQAEQTQQHQEQKAQVPTPMEGEGAGREGGKRPRSGGASPELSRRRLDEDPLTPLPEREPGGVDLRTDTRTALCMMDADQPGIAPSARTIGRWRLRRFTYCRQVRWPPPRHPRSAMPTACSGS